MSEPVTCIRKPEPITEPTPGPWWVSEIGSVWSPHNGLVAVVYPCAVSYRAEMLANARLIAAAPDLLAFARRTLPMLIAERASVYEGCSVPATGEVPDEDDREVIAMIDREIDELRALIARAEGTA